MGGATVTQPPDSFPEVDVPYAGDAPRAPRPIWPMAVGAASTGLAVVNLLLYIFYSSCQWYPNILWTPPVWISVLLAFLNVQLLAAGLNLLQRRSRAWRMHLLYTACAIPLSGYALCETARTMRFVIRRLLLGGQPFDVLLHDIAQAAWGLWLILNVVYALFLLVWFLRRDIRTQAAAWPDRPPKRRKPGGAP